MKQSMWFLIWEKDFINWLNSINIKTNYIEKTRPYTFSNTIKSKLDFDELDLIIEWKSDLDFGNKETGSSVSEILISTWEGGFEYESKWIKIEKWTGDKTKVKYRINKEVDEIDMDPNTDNVLKELENFFIILFPKWSTRIIRSNNLRNILNN
jgi:hypothetical protein